MSLGILIVNKHMRSTRKDSVKKYGTNVKETCKLTVLSSVVATHVPSTRLPSFKSHINFVGLLKSFF